MSAKPLILFVQWFGPWPEWIDFFVESCRWNTDIDWLIFTDQDPPENTAPNVGYRKVGFAAHVARIYDAIGIPLPPIKPYKLCDLKPTLGFVFADEAAGYANYGHADLDQIFGDIRAVYTDALLARYAAISTHADRMSGHLTVLRNTPFNRTAFRRIRSWRRKLATPQHFGIDEYRFGNVFRRASLWRKLTTPRVPALFEERYLTPMTPKPWLDGTWNFPTRWFWKEGKVTAEGCGDREFLAIHFMNWKASSPHRIIGGDGTPPWSKLERVVTIDWRKAAAEGFTIGHSGIGPLP
jgi:hypothetical protein